MKLLLDTHTLIWALEDNPRLSDFILDMITDLDNQIYVSVASIWEITIKYNCKKDFPYNPNDIVTLCQRAGFIFLDIGVESVLETFKLSIHNNEYANNDPFDRILIAQAKNNNMKFLTHDNVFLHYNEPSIIFF